MNNVLTAFKEYKNFMLKKPWDSNIQVFPTNTVVPPHYAETIEVLLCCNIKGSIYIGGQHFKFGGKQVFFIAPTVIHSIDYLENDGYVNVLKINQPQFQSILDLNALLACYNKTMLNLPIALSNFDDVKKIADVFSPTSYIDQVLQAILELFHILILNSNDSNMSYTTSSNADLRSIINWTEANYYQKISIDEIATMIGYEKHYFCNKFKELTGITYLTYLNNLRINHACKALKNGASITQASGMCGFDNVSYFVQLFKKIIGTTPKKYTSTIANNVTT